jgi:hypothetical protein
MSDRPYLIVSDTHLGAVPDATERAFRRFLAFAAENSSAFEVCEDAAIVFTPPMRWLLRYCAGCIVERRRQIAVNECRSSVPSAACPHVASLVPAPGVLPVFDVFAGTTESQVALATGPEAGLAMGVSELQPR